MQSNRFALSQWTLAVLVAGAAFVSDATEFHVSQTGSDSNPGTLAAPFRRIQRAADAAQPGDTITVHRGTYRERVNPPRGGLKNKPIVYQAAPGESVEIKGSEVINGWAKVEGDVWQVALPNSFFGNFNPFRESIRGDWFDPRGRGHHRGAVYVNGQWLSEAAALTNVLNQASTAEQLWFSEVGENETIVWARFSGVNPNEQLVEVNARPTVFYPDQPGRDYITVRGFTLQQAATQWAPPTAEQIAVIGTHWSQGWIIESNTVKNSVCSGISLGKYGDAWDNTSADTAEGYVKTIERALTNGWNKETIGHHVVRNNTISHCEQAGIVGSLGAAFSVISSNTIHDIHVRRLFSGAEMAGIKFHAAIDTVIRNNHIYRTCLGLWLDWMAQGTRVSGNLFHGNPTDLFVEVDHGPFIVDNNVFLSGTSLLDVSEGGAYVHNLFAGRFISHPEPNRETPFHPAHVTQMAGLRTIKGGDDRFYNNIFVGPSAVQPKKDASGYGLCVYDERPYALQTGGNFYFAGAQPYRTETNSVIQPALSPKLRLTTSDHTTVLESDFGTALQQASPTPVTTERLGRALIPNLPYEAADGSPIRFETDYFGRQRDSLHPMPGPFESFDARLVLDR